MMFEPDLVIKNVWKTYKYDQDKVRSPEETIRWVKERFKASGLDILLKTMRIDTGRLGIPVYISLCGKDASKLTNTRKQMGKGATPSQSEASALMELAERFSFFSYIRTSSFPLKTWEDIEGSEAFAPYLLRSIHDEKTPLREVLGFLRKLPMRWVTARNITVDRNQWIPLDWFYLINEYNGPAAGNTLEEAILQSLCEVVERHVGTIVSYNQLETPPIDLATVEARAAKELIGRFHGQNIKLFVNDFSLGTGIPSVGVLAYDPSTFPAKSEIIFTVGTTTDPEKSLCRALTEVAQLAGDFETRTSYKPTFPKYKSLEEASYIINSSKYRPVSMNQLPSLAHDNLFVEIRRAVETLKSTMDWDVFVVNVTHPLLAVPAVYTIIPGAHFLDRAGQTDFPQHIARTILSYMSPRDASFYIETLVKTFGARPDLLFFQGYGEYGQGRIENALELYDRALHSKGLKEDERASIIINIAACWKDLGDYEKALHYLGEAAEGGGHLKEYHHTRGVCLYYLRRFEEAVEAFERVIEMDPGSAIDYANIASSLKEMGYIKEAIALYEVALDMDSSLDFAKNNLEKLKMLN